MQVMQGRRGFPERIERDRAVPAERPCRKRRRVVFVRGRIVWGEQDQQAVVALQHQRAEADHAFAVCRDVQRIHHVRPAPVEMIRRRAVHQVRR